jgi:hypothetical protein
MSIQTSPSNMSAKRPPALTAWLLLTIVSALAAISNALLTKSSVLLTWPRLQSPIFEVFVGAGILSLIGSMTMLFRKRWGFFLSCVSMFAVGIVDLYIGASIHLAAALIMFIVLALLVRKEWRRFT